MHNYYCVIFTSDYVGGWWGWWTSITEPQATIITAAIPIAAPTLANCKPGSYDLQNTLPCCMHASTCIYLACNIFTILLVLDQFCYCLFSMSLGLIKHCQYSMVFTCTCVVSIYNYIARNAGGEPELM